MRRNALTLRTVITLLCRAIVATISLRYYEAMEFISDVVSFLSQKAPFSMAEKWDNVGLLVGDKNNELKKILAGIELSGPMIEEAVKVGANLIITHHPVFFKGTKRLNFSTQEEESNWVRRMIKEDISLLTLHTNFDRAPSSLHTHLFSQLEIQNCRPLETLRERDAQNFPEGAGYGIQGELKTEVKAVELMPKLKETFDIPGIRFSGDLSAKIKRVGFVSGAGMFMWQKALREGADLFISGDVKHHEAVDAVNAGLNVVDVGHFGAEKHFATVMQKWLSEEEIEVNLFMGNDPFQFFI